MGEDQTERCRIKWVTLVAPLTVTLFSVMLDSGLVKIMTFFSIELADKTYANIDYAVISFIWLTFAWLITRLVELLFWDYFLLHQCGHQTPKLLKDIGKLLIFFIAILIIFGVVLDKSITGLLAASGAVGLVVGLALRNVISDMFDGVSINIDKPFKIGDFVFLHDRALNIDGRVIETTWRTTRFTTDGNHTLVVPNSKICSIAITNFSTNPLSCFTYDFILEGEIRIAKASDVILSACKATGVVEPSHEPAVKVKGVQNGGVIYSLTYWIESGIVGPIEAKNRVVSSVIMALRYSGMKFAVPRERHLVQKAPMIDYNQGLPPVELLRRIHLFSSLTLEELESLSHSLQCISANENDTIIEIDHKDNSLFIVTEGLLEVLVSMECHLDEEKELTHVKYLCVGEIFGEMSLLTGVPRSATVIARSACQLYQLDKQSLEPLFKNRPELIREMSQIVTARKIENKKKQDQLYQQDQEQEPTSLVDELVAKIKTFFHL